jgi:hypothetical protein
MKNQGVPFTKPVLRKLEGEKMVAVILVQAVLKSNLKENVT